MAVCISTGYTIALNAPSQMLRWQIGGEQTEWKQMILSFGFDVGVGIRSTRFDSTQCGDIRVSTWRWEKRFNQTNRDPNRKLTVVYIFFSLHFCIWFAIFCDVLLLFHSQKISEQTHTHTQNRLHNVVFILRSHLAIQINSFKFKRKSHRRE